MNQAILVIDDDQYVLAMLSETLCDFGYEVMQARNGEEAVDSLRNGRVSPALIVTDLLMPRKHGVDTILEIKSLNIKARILAISGGGGGKVGDVLADARHAGADATLAKPFDMNEFEAVIKKLIS